MMSHAGAQRGLRTCLVGASSLVLTAGLAGAAVAGTTSDTLPNGAELSVSVDSPVTGDTFLIPAGDTSMDVPLTGTASVGEGGPSVSWIYVVDVSGSTGNACAGGTILDCEKTAVIGLDALIAADGSGLESGLAAFASSSATADVSSAAGDQSFTVPGDPDLAVAVSSLSEGAIGAHTVKGGLGSQTNYVAALQAADTLASAAAGAQVNVVFLSDGVSFVGDQADFDTTLAAVSAKATIYPFAVGAGSSCSGGIVGTLNDMAAASGTECFAVPDPADLPDVITNVTATTLTDLEVTLDGTPVSATTNPALPLAGPDSLTWDAVGEDLTPGEYEVCATADGVGPASDPEATESVTRCETFAVFGFDLTPPEATNELGEDDTHTVTATVSGPDGQLAGWPVDFSVAAGPNAGESGTCDPADCTTDASGEVTFTYTVPVEPDSLGQDTISATVDVNGDTATLEVGKLWQDTTPPVASCVEGPNPGGKTPRSPGGGSAQNPDGFYTLLASDDVWPDEALEVYVTDDGTGHVFGPFAVGDDIKYTEANGAPPKQKQGSGEVEWQLRGQGDAVLTAVDGSGNESEPVMCRVPNPPQ